MNKGYWLHVGGAALGTMLASGLGAVLAQGRQPPLMLAFAGVAWIFSVWFIGRMWDHARVWRFRSLKAQMRHRRTIHQLVRSNTPRSPFQD